MATEMALIDMSSCVSEIVEVRSDVQVNFLVVLVRVFEAVAPSSPLEGLSVVVVLEFPDPPLIDLNQRVVGAGPEWSEPILRWRGNQRASSQPDRWMRLDHRC